MKSAALSVPELNWLTMPARDAAVPADPVNTSSWRATSASHDENGA
jgi:hypothetical protein